jgi:hypothetical protein
MSTAYYDYSIDPVTNTVYPYILRSLTKGGTTTNKIGVPDLTISAAANFPSTNTTSTPSRYFIELPMDVYYTSTNTSSFSVRNETQSRALTIVTPTATLSNYTCKFMNTGSERKSVLEVHVGSTSNQAGDSLSYEGYFAGSVLKSTVTDNFYISGLSCNSTATIADLSVTNRLLVNGAMSTTVDTGGIAIKSTVSAASFLSVSNVNVTSTLATNEVLRMTDAGAGGFGGIKITTYSTTIETLRLQAEVATGVTGTEGVLIESKVGGSGHTGNYLSVKNGASYLLRVQGNGNVTTNNFLIATGGCVTKSYSSNAFNPTNANLQTAFGASTAKTAGWVGIIGSSGSTFYIVASDASTSYFYATMTRAT